MANIQLVPRQENNRAPFPIDKAGKALLSQDEALTAVLRKYRNVFPQDTLPSNFEAAAVLMQNPGKETMVVHVTLGLRGQCEPFVLFRATVSRLAGEIAVETIGDWHELQGKELDVAKSL